MYTPPYSGTFAEFKERTDQALKETLHDICYKPQDFSDRKQEHVAFLMVKVPDAAGKVLTASSIRVSPDGSQEAAAWIPLSKCFCGTTDGDFTIVTMPGWIVIDRKFLQGEVPVLSSSIEWTDERRAAHKKLRIRLQIVRGDLKFAEQKRKYPGRRIYRHRLMHSGQ